MGSNTRVPDKEKNGAKIAGKLNFYQIDSSFDIFFFISEWKIN
jgi:hypothetical protein